MCLRNSKFTVAFACVGLFLITVFGCTDRTYNQYGSPEFGAITGQIRPIDPSARVSLDGTNKSTKPDPTGYFFLGDLPSSVYTLAIESETYSTRRIRGVPVQAGVVENLGGIVLSTLPPPIFGTTPVNGQEGLPRGASISFDSDEQLDFESLRGATTISPPIALKWTSEGVYGNQHYWRYWGTLGDARVAETYEVRIDTTLKSVIGNSLESELIWNFTMEPLEASVWADPLNAAGEARLRTFSIMVRFNDSVVPDSFLRAVSILPELDGRWFRDERGGSFSSFYFVVSGETPTPDTDYRVTIREDVLLTGSVHLPARVTFICHTEKSGVTTLSPDNGQVVYPTATRQITINFNQAVDSSSVEGAFSLYALEKGEIGGQFAWDVEHFQLTFTPNSELPAATMYRITLGGDMRFKNGTSLGEDFVSYFRII